MKELSDLLREVFVDRLKNKLMAAFLISWLVWNWKLIAHLFWGDGTLEARIESYSTNLALVALQDPLS